MPEKTRRTSGRDDLALARICCAIAGIQQLHERNDAVKYRGTVQVIDSIKILCRCLPGVLNEFRKSVLGFQI